MCIGSKLMKEELWSLCNVSTYLYFSEFLFLYVSGKGGPQRGFGTKEILRGEEKQQSLGS